MKKKTNETTPVIAAMICVFTIGLAVFTITSAMNANKKEAHELNGTGFTYSDAAYPTAEELKATVGCGPKIFK